MEVKTKTTDFYRASDYAGLRAGNLDFYYGYEFGRNDDGEVWGFRAKRNGRVVLEYPHEPPTDKFDVVSELMTGIARYLIQEQKP
jgi:hypothetical protein